MISKQEHNYIIDTLIKRIEQLEKEVEAKDNIIEMFKNTKDKKQQHLNKIRTEHELLLLDYEALVKLNNHKDEVIKQLKKEGR